MVDVVGQVFDLVRAGVVAQRHPGRDDQAVRAHVHGLQLEQPVHARRLLDLLADHLAHLGVGGPADKQFPAVHAEPEGHHDQQHPDGDRGAPVIDRGAGDLLQQQAAGGQREPDDRRSVLEQRGLDRRVPAGLDVLQGVRVRAVGLAAQLAVGPEERGALGDGAHGQHHVRDQEVVRLAVQRENALEDREARARDEDPERGEQRPEVAFLPIPERVLLVGRALALADRGEQEDLVERVRERVGRLGQHRAGAGEDPGRQLGQHDDDVGPAGDEHRAGGGLPRLGLLLCPRLSRPGCHSRPAPAAVAFIAVQLPGADPAKPAGWLSLASLSGLRAAQPRCCSV